MQGDKHNWKAKAEPLEKSFKATSLGHSMRLTNTLPFPVLPCMAWKHISKKDHQNFTFSLAVSSFYF